MSNDLSIYIGKKYYEAHDLATSNGLKTRIVNINRMPVIVTRDYKPDRLNFSLELDVVTDCHLG